MESFNTNLSNVTERKSVAESHRDSKARLGMRESYVPQSCEEEMTPSELRKRMNWEERQMKKFHKSVEFNHLKQQMRRERARVQCKARCYLRKLERGDKLEAREFDDGEAQGFFTDVASMPEAVNKAMHGISGATESVTELLETLKEAVSNIFGNLTELDLTQLVLILTQIVFGFVDNSKKTIMLQLLSLARLLNLDFDAVSSKCSEYYNRWLNGGQKPTGEEVGVAQGEGLDCAMPAFSMLAGFVLTALYGGNFAFKSYAESLSSFGRAAMGWKSIMQMIEYAITWLKRVYTMWSKGKTLAQVEFEEEVPGFEELFASTEFLLHEMAISCLDKSPILCKKVLAVYNRWEKIRFDAYRVHHRELVAQAQAMLNSLRKLHEAALNSPALTVSVRSKPLAIYLFGKPGVGKTILQSVLDYKLFGDFCAEQEGRNLADVFFSRKVENDYWDGYRNQPIIHYDDFLQKPDSLNQPNPEYMEIIRLVNEDVMQLHMASCEDKKSTFFDSEFIICTSNKENPQPMSLTDPNAFYRRFDFFVDVKVHKDFADSTGKYDSAKINEHRQKHKIETSLTTFQYRFDLYSLHKKDDTSLEKKVLVRDLTFEQFYDKLKTRVAESKKQTDALRNDLLKLAGYSATKTSTVYQLEDKLARMERRFAEISEEDVSCEGLATVLQSTQAEGDAEGLEEFKDAVYTKPLMTLKRMVPAEPVSMFRETIKRYRKNAAENMKILGEILGEVAEKAQTLAQKAIECLSNFFSSNKGKVLLAVLGGIVGGLGLTSLTKYFETKLCKKSSMNSVDDFLYSRPCEKCSLCKLVFPQWHDERVGDLDYHVTALGNVIMYFPTESTRQRAVSVLQIMASRLNAESGETTSRRRARMAAESNETQTRRKALMNAESNETSTMRRKRMEAESNETTTMRKQKLCAELGMADVVTHILEEDGVAQVLDRVLNEQHLKVSYTNSVRVSYEVGNSELVMNGVFVRGTILMVPYHFLAMKQQSTSGLKVETVLGKKDDAQEVPWNRLRIHRCVRADGAELDLALIELPRVFASRPDISKMFISSSQVGKLEEGEVVVATYRMYKGDTMLNTFTSRYAYLRPFCKYTLAKTGEVFTMTNGLRYDVGTMRGDCGALVYAKNNLIASKIAGVHLAGYQGEGAAQVVTRELLERNVVLLNPNPLANIDGRIPYDAEVEVKRVVPKDSVSALGDCMSLGVVTKPHMASASAIIPSAIHGMVNTPIMKQAHLKPVKIGDTVVDPLEKGLQKVLGVQKVIDPVLVDKAAQDIKNLYRETMPQKPEVYDYETAVRGIEGVCRGINRRTSPGYPYSLFNPKGGKKHWFGEGEEYVYNDEIRQDVDQIIENAKMGKRSDVIFSATLKDERRPIEKVDAGKTRVFEAAPQHFVIACRKYFLAFSNAMTQSRINNEVAVGTNVYSYDWTRIATEMKRFGPAVVAGDFSNFDGSLNQELLWKVCEIINDWYDDGEENRFIRQMLFEEMVCANVMVPRSENGELIRQTHSQPSGNPLTVIINSIFNQLVMRMAYLMCKKEAGLGGTCDFRDHVAFCTYGDDNLLNIDSDIVEWFNQITMTKVLAELGLTYTEETKSGKMQEYRTLNDVGFLKRKFVEDGFGGFKAPLDFGVVCEMVNWCKGKEIRGATAENVETSLIELALHGEEVYNTQVEKLRRACRDVNVRPKFRTFNEIDEMHYESRYGEKLYVPSWAQDIW